VIVGSFFTRRRSVLALSLKESLTSEGFLEGLRGSPVEYPLQRAEMGDVELLIRTQQVGGSSPSAPTDRDGARTASLTG
jgi:hypothetical protein